jgi:HEAT repeat protein
LEADKNVEGLIGQFCWPDLREYGAEALVNIGGSQVAEALVGQLNRDPTGQFGLDVVETLVKIGDVSVEHLVKLIKEHEIIGSSIHAVKLYDRVGLALSKIGKAAIEPLLQMQKEDTDLRIQEFIAKVFGKIKDPCLIEPLMQILKNTKSSNAALSLGNIGGERVIEPIIEVIKILKWYNRSSDDYANYSNAFILIGEPAIAPLSAALDSDNRVVRKISKKAIKMIKKNLKKGIIPQI